MLIVSLIKTLRPYQWYKNLLLFVGLIFSYNLTNTDYFIRTLLGFVFFCLMSGSIYILNDVMDRKKDRLHPIKNKRPIASGELSIKLAIPIMVFLAAGCPIASSFLINGYFSLILVIYFIIFVLYTFLLKNMVLIDAFTISAGFVLRAIAGISSVEGAKLSWWLIICTFLLALFLAFGKRRSDMVEMGEKKTGEYRKVYREYSVEMLDHFITISACATIVVYCLYSALAPHNGMVLTIPFVIFGVFRYLQLMHIRNLGAEPEKVFSDVYMVAAMGLWIATVLFILYGNVDIVLDFIKF
ncbi:MAG: decaprenyl-phosphate phosphoribosyltransferase [Candidatus Thermoplasmatota archaeon]|nr:decaprenyl-phosphate phosphoribosyltransferase [Candidatus Thermoplasmatota archaeon]MDP7265489.1 decaprenyl-phosphate phosphoribosyltransferase [Candidatus Thermoplasmatota archaeon]